MPDFEPEQNLQAVYIDARRATDSELCEQVGLDPVDLSSMLCGSAPNTEVHVEASIGKYGEGTWELASVATNELFTAARTITKIGGEIEIENRTFFLRDGVPKGTGIGLKIFTKQVEAAARSGVKTISTLAARGGRDGKLNGYYTWPRMGYDARLDDALDASDQKDVASKFPKATHVSDLMRTPQGRTWWKENGVGGNMRFDVRDGSLSRRILAEYNAEVEADRASGKRFAEIEAREYHAEDSQGDEPPYIVDEIIDRIWDRIAVEESQS